jgi:hypothetical protein
MWGQMRPNSANVADALLSVLIDRFCMGLARRVSSVVGAMECNRHVGLLMGRFVMIKNQ